MRTMPTSNVPWCKLKRKPSKCTLSTTSLHSFRNHLSTDLTPRIRLSNRIGDGTKTMLKDHLSTTISATLLQTTAGTTRLRATTTATATSTTMLPRSEEHTS